MNDRIVVTFALNEAGHVTIAACRGKEGGEDEHLQHIVLMRGRLAARYGRTRFVQSTPTQNVKSTTTATNIFTNASQHRERERDSCPGEEEERDSCRYAQHLGG